jgi:hypothetical protein
MVSFSFAFEGAGLKLIGRVVVGTGMFMARRTVIRVGIWDSRGGRWTGRFWRS